MLSFALGGGGEDNRTSELLRWVLEALGGQRAIASPVLGVATERLSQGGGLGCTVSLGSSLLSPPPVVPLPSLPAFPAVYYCRLQRSQRKLRTLPNAHPTPFPREGYTNWAFSTLDSARERVLTRKPAWWGQGPLRPRLASVPGTLAARGSQVQGQVG